MFGRDGSQTRMRRTILWGGLFSFTLVLQGLARGVPGFADWYAARVYPVIVRALGGLCGLIPVAVDELAIYGITAALLWYLGVSIRKIRRGELRFGLWAGRSFGGLLKIGILWFFVFTANCGINYHRTLFSELAGLDVRASDVDELEGLCLWLTGEINSVSEELIFQENGLTALPEQMLAKTRSAMEKLGEEYPQLEGWYPKAKPVLTWPVLSWQLLEGMYGPYTVEAHYNPDMPAYAQAAVVCHELSHLKGFMREDEANYIAYMGCLRSEDPGVRYSGLTLAYVYSINALYRTDRERAMQVREQLCGQAELDFAYYNGYWEQYRGTISKVSDRINDAYLKANAQKDGTKSYGRMVDLLIGEYRKSITNPFPESGS